MAQNERAAEGLRIRRIGAQDRAEWGRLWTAYLEFYGTTLPPEVHDTTFALLLTSAAERGAGDGPHGLIAEAEGQPVGLVHYIFHAHCWRPEGVCYLQDLFTTPEARGRGVARALIMAVYDAADAAGRPAVYWLTQAQNRQARVLYDQVAQATDFIKYARALA